MALRKLTSKSGFKTDEKIDWSGKGANDWKKKIKDRATKQDDQDPPKILFMGETGSGKSSYISSVVSALSGDITYTSTIGEQTGREFNTSKRYLEHRVFIEGEDKPLNFILCDSRGIAKRNQEGVADKEIERLIDGKLRHNDLIESERSSDGVMIDSREPKPPSCVVFVQKAQRLGQVDKDVEDKLKQAMDLVRGRGIPSCVILTHIDKVKPSLEKKLEMALDSEKIRDRVKKASKETGVNTNRVFVVKNYTDERRTHKQQDILILRALDGILVDAYRRCRDDRTRDLVRPLSMPECGLHGVTSSTASVSSNNGGRDDSAYSSSLLTESLRRSFAGDGASAGKSIVVHRQSFVGQPAQQTNLLQADCTPFPHGLQDAQPHSTEKFERSNSQFLKYVIPRNDQSPTESKSNSYDSLRETVDPTGDAGIGGSVASSEYSLSFLQKTINTLDKNPFPKSYSEHAEFKGSKPLYKPTVLQMDHTNKMTTESDTKLSRHLPKAMYTSDEEDDYRRLYEILQEVSGGKTGSIWMSKTLPLDFGLPLESCPPVSMIIQALFLAHDHPAFLLTVYDPEKVLQGENIDTQEKSQQMIEEETTEVWNYTVEMGKLLMTALLNYCCCDFILLPCTIQLRDLNPDSLQKEVKKQVHKSGVYYGGPKKMNESSYIQLKQAATFVTGVTHVPHLMGELDLKQEHLVLMDPDWRGVVSILIEDLTCGQGQPVTYPRNGRVKMKVAVMEAAKRLSFTETVVILTHDEQLQECCRLLKEKVFEETGVSLNLFVTAPSDASQPDAPQVADYIILLDCRKDIPVDTDSMVLRISEQKEWSWD